MYKLCMYLTPHLRMYLFNRTLILKERLFNFKIINDL